MAADLSLWKLEDCLSFLAQTLKTYKDPLTDEMVESLNAVFKTNHGTGDVLFRFTDEEWKELIPAVCLRVHVRDAFKRVIQNDEKAAISQLHRKGLSKKPVSEVTQMVPVPRITSFFRPLSVLALPDHDYLFSLPVDPCLPVESVNIVDLESVTKLIQQNQHLHSMRERSDFSSRLMRKVICTFFSLNDNNIRRAATKLTTALSHPASGSDSDSAACAAMPRKHRRIARSCRRVRYRTAVTSRRRRRREALRHAAKLAPASHRASAPAGTRPAPRSHATAELCAARRCRALDMRVAHRK